MCLTFFGTQQAVHAAVSTKSIGVGTAKSPFSAQPTIVKSTPTEALDQVEEIEIDLETEVQ